MQVFAFGFDFPITTHILSIFSNLSKNTPEGKKYIYTREIRGQSYINLLYHVFFKNIVTSIILLKYTCVLFGIPLKSIKNTIYFHTKTWNESDFPLSDFYLFVFCFLVYETFPYFLFATQTYLLKWILLIFKII